MEEKEPLKPVPFEQIFPAHWIYLPHEIREHLAKVFGIGRSVATEIVDNRLVSDGRSVRDLAAVTKEKMEAYIGGGTEDMHFYDMWNVCISKAKVELNPPKDLQPSASVDKPVETVDKSPEPVVEEKKNVNGFRPASEKESTVFNILNKNSKNDKPKSTKKK